MMLWRVGMYSGVLLIGAGDLPITGEAGPWLQWGAIGVLAWACNRLFSELAAMREQNDRTFERFDGWERVRHDDHETLTSTLAELRENCAAVNRQRATNEIPPASLPKD